MQTREARCSSVGSIVAEILTNPANLHSCIRRPILQEAIHDSFRHRLTKTGVQLTEMGVMPRAHLTIPTRAHRTSSPLTVATYRARTMSNAEKSAA